jgi:hypothetical protein
MQNKPEKENAPKPRLISIEDFEALMSPEQMKHFADGARFIYSPETDPDETNHSDSDESESSKS